VLVLHVRMLISSVCLSSVAKTPFTAVQMWSHEIVQLLHCTFILLVCTCSMVLRNFRVSVDATVRWVREREVIPIILLIHNTSKRIRLAVASKSCRSSTFATCLSIMHRACSHAASLCMIMDLSILASAETNSKITQCQVSYLSSLVIYFLILAVA